jgi:hypothetical protein
MSAIQQMRFNWLPKPSAYSEARAWTAKQQALREHSDTMAVMSDNLMGALPSQTQGVNQLVAKAALARIQSAARTKATKALNSASSTTATSAPKSSAVTGEQYLDGGSKLNLDAGTLTLRSGKVIDISR